MAEWELTVGDESRYYLAVTLEERRIDASGDILAPLVMLPFGWKEILDKGERQEAWTRVMAVSLNLHPDQTQNRFWVRTGFQPVTRAAPIPTLPLTHPLIEVLSLARTNPGGDIALNISLQVLATDRNSSANPRVYWHQNAQAVRRRP